MNVKAPAAFCLETMSMAGASMNASMRPAPEGLIINSPSISPDSPAIDTHGKLQGNHLQPVAGRVGVFQLTDSGLQFLD